MNSRLILVMSLFIVSSRCQKEIDEPVDNPMMNKALQDVKKSLQTNVTKKCHSVLIYEEVIPPTIIESDETTDIILQNLTSETDQAEIVDADADEGEESLRQKRRAGRVVRVCNRRRRRRCRYVIIIRRRGRRRNY